MVGPWATKLLSDVGPAGHLLYSGSKFAFSNSPKQHNLPMLLVLSCPTTGVNRGHGWPATGREPDAWRSSAMGRDGVVQPIKRTPEKSPHPHSTTTKYKVHRLGKSTTKNPH